MPLIFIVLLVKRKDSIEREKEENMTTKHAPKTQLRENFKRNLTQQQIVRPASTVMCNSIESPKHMIKLS